MGCLALFLLMVAFSVICCFGRLCWTYIFITTFLGIVSRFCTFEAKPSRLAFSAQNRLNVCYRLEVLNQFSQFFFAHNKQSYSLSGSSLCLLRYHVDFNFECLWIPDLYFLPVLRGLFYFKSTDGSVTIETKTVQQSAKTSFWPWEL